MRQTQPGVCVVFLQGRLVDMSSIQFDKYETLMDRSYVSQLGKVAKVVGLTIESIGPSAKLNDLCLIKSNTFVMTGFF